LAPNLNILIVDDVGVAYMHKHPSDWLSLIMSRTSEAAYNVDIV